MRRPFCLGLILILSTIGCATLKGQRIRPRGPATVEELKGPGVFTYNPVSASGAFHINPEENSVTTIQGGVKLTLKFLGPDEKKKAIRGSGVFPEDIFEAVLVTVENKSGSKVRLPLSEAVLICQSNQFNVLTYREAVLLAAGSMTKYAQQAAESYLRAGLSPTYARQMVTDQSFRAIHGESGLSDYDWIEEHPTITVFPTVGMSRILMWDALKVHRKLTGEGDEKVRVIIPDVALEFDTAGNPSKVADFWFDFRAVSGGSK
ncbi:MAG TPA: hypothetical protein EYP53_00245 [Candidatus Latescibacteria bacterium]|nr:hypothetical protein [Candidatus Latescibacterota bacterium]